MWLTNESFLDFSKKVWTQEQNEDITNRQWEYKKRITQWSRDNFGNIQKDLSEIRDRLVQIQAGDYSEEDIREEQTLMDKYNKILINEEIFWRQRSRITWIKEGDRNNKFFHATTLNRRRKNNISAIRDQNGDWTERPA